MPVVPRFPWLEIEQIDKVTAVRFTRPMNLEGDSFDTIGKQLTGLMESEGRKRFVINCGNVESLSTTMLGKLFKLHQKLVAAGGMLVLCNASPFLAQIFEVVELPLIIRVFDSEQDAVQTYQPRKQV